MPPALPLALLAIPPAAAPCVHQCHSAGDQHSSSHGYTATSPGTALGGGGAVSQAGCARLAEGDATMAQGPGTVCWVQVPCGGSGNPMPMGWAANTMLRPWLRCPSTAAVTTSVGQHRGRALPPAPRSAFPQGAERAQLPWQCHSAQRWKAPFPEERDGLVGGSAQGLGLSCQASSSHSLWPVIAPRIFSARWGQGPPTSCRETPIEARRAQPARGMTAPHSLRVKALSAL